MSENNKATKRKASLKYKVWLIALLIFFVVAFLILVFRVRIFEKFDRAEVIGFEDYGADYKITYVVDGKEYYAIWAFTESASSQFFNGKLEYIIYQVSDPTYTFINRNKELIPLLIFACLFLLGIIPLTIYEVKKGF